MSLRLGCLEFRGSTHKGIRGTSVVDMSPGSVFEMSSLETLNDARIALGLEGILSRRTRNHPASAEGPYLAVHHPDAQRDRVRRIVEKVDAKAIARG